MQACVRASLLPLIVLLAGCPSGSSYTGNGAAAVDDAGCFYGCDQPCRGVSVCVSYPFVSSCQPPCVSGDDCAAGSECLALTTDGFSPTVGGVCANPAQLHICGADRPCPPLSPQCKNATVLMKPLSYPSNVCGYALVSCPNGCDAARAQCR
jgi:hypothetical protein